MSGLNDIVIVLYQPQDIVNVGGVVRVMSNFGLRRLRLVEPAAYDPYRIGGVAHHTEEIINAIERYSTLEEALADCGYVLGTTARKRGVRREYLTPRQAGPYLFKYAQANPGQPAALLFGREDNGLPNEALDLCHAIINIPTDPMNSSLNLAQAAMIVAYEVWMAAHPEVLNKAGAKLAPQSIPTTSDETNSNNNQATTAASESDTQHSVRVAGAPPRWGDLPGSLEALEAALTEDEKLASGTDREEMFAALADLLRTLHPDTTDLRMTYAMTRLRAILLRAAPRREEARLLAHLFQHISRRIRPKEPRR
jgi:tRNA/rRNA methyltransferase/tRNA (cytidine32/uridine32-2'-O)-methyltransferase